MQINSNIQSNVLATQNKAAQKVEQTQVEEANIQQANNEEKLTERKFQEIINIQDDMMAKANLNNESNRNELREDLARIDESLKVANNNQRFVSEDFSKLNQNIIKANEESFKNSQQANITQAQLASLLA